MQAVDKEAFAAVQVPVAPCTLPFSRPFQASRGRHHPVALQSGCAPKRQDRLRRALPRHLPNPLPLRQNEFQISKIQPKPQEYSEPTPNNDVPTAEPELFGQKDPKRAIDAEIQQHE